MIFNFKTWCIYIYYFEGKKSAAHHCGRKQSFPKQVCIYIYITYTYIHTYIYGAVNTDTHGWGRATETLALGCPGTTTRFRDLLDTGTGCIDISVLTIPICQRSPEQGVCMRQQPQ